MSLLVADAKWNASPLCRCYHRPMLIKTWGIVLVLQLIALPLSPQVKPCKSTATGDQEKFSLTSRTFRNARTVRVWLPPGYRDPANSGKKYPILYLLDGDSAFNACDAFMHDELHADETLTTLIASGRIPPLIAVAIDNASDILGHTEDGVNSDQGKARTREYLPYPDPFLAPEIQDVLGAQLPAFFENDVFPVIAKRYRVLSGAEHSALWGDSYAGAAALYIAMHRPDLFGRMIIESPSLQIGNGQLLRDSTFLTGLPHRIALGIGTAEISEGEMPNSATINAAWIRQMHVLADNLKAAADFPAEVQLTVAEGAHHSTGDFGKRLAAGLLFIYASEPAAPSDRSSPSH